MDSGEIGMNPNAMTIINPRKEYRPSRGSNQQPPVLKSCTLPTELWGSAAGKGENAGNLHFLPFQQCFLPFSSQGHFCCLQMLSIWTSLIFLYGKDITHGQTDQDNDSKILRKLGLGGYDNMKIKHKLTLPHNPDF